MLLCLFAWTRGCLLIVMWCNMQEERNYGISQGQSFFPASQHPNQHKFSGKIFYFDKDWFLAVLPYQYLPTLWIKVKFPRKEISSHLIVIVIIALYRQSRVHKKRNNLKYRALGQEPVSIDHNTRPESGIKWPTKNPEITLALYKILRSLRFLWNLLYLVVHNYFFRLWFSI